MENNENKDTIKMVENALMVLDYLKQNEEPQGVNDIAKKCGLNPSSAFRILKSMELEGWVFQLNDDRYIPGEKLSFVATKNNFYLALQEISAPIMEACAQKHNHPMNLMVLDDKYCVILQQARTKNLVDYVTPKYTRLPFYTSASGKILMSELNLNVIEDIMNRTTMNPITPHTLCDEDDYWRELRKTTARGYAFDNHESSLIGSAIAVPIRGKDKEIIASLSMCGIIGVKDPEEMTVYLPALRETADKISKMLYAYIER